MDKATKDLIAKKMARAQDDLRVAKKLEAQGDYRQAISRSYYAIFAAASAALLSKGVTRKKHTGVEFAFNQYLAHTGLVARKLATTYRDAFNARHDADYSDLVEFGAERARDVLSESVEFVQAMESFLREQGALG